MAVGGRFKWRFKDELEHRRNTIRDLQGQGYTITQIAQQLQLSVPTIKRISAKLHRESRENYQRLVIERIPYEVENTLALYKSIKRQAKELADHTDKDIVKVRALDLMQRAGKEHIELLMRGDYVKRALDVAGHIQKKLDELPNTMTEEADTTTTTAELEDEDGEEEEELEEEEAAHYGSQRKF